MSSNPKPTTIQAASLLLFRKWYVLVGVLLVLLIMGGIAGGITALLLQSSDWKAVFLQLITSPFIVAIAALAAAVIGFNSILEQIKANQTAQTERAAQDKERQESDHWWKNFEWATDWAFPQSGQSQVPDELLVRFLSPMANEYPNDRAATAVGDLTNFLTERIELAEKLKSELILNEGNQGSEQKSNPDPNPQPSSEPVTPEPPTEPKSSFTPEMVNSSFFQSLRLPISPKLPDATDFRTRLNELLKASRQTSHKASLDALRDYSESTQNKPSSSASASNYVFKNDVYASLKSILHKRNPNALLDLDTTLIRPSASSTTFEIVEFTDRGKRWVALLHPEELDDVGALRIALKSVLNLSLEIPFLVVSRGSGPVVYMPSREDDRRVILCGWHSPADDPKLEEALSGVDPNVSRVNSDN